jgi:hypothetical protein
MKELAADYLGQHAVPKKRPRSVESDRSMLDRITFCRGSEARRSAPSNRATSTRCM